MSNNTVVTDTAKTFARATDYTTRSRNKPGVVCVFCGASPGIDEKHLEAARKLAHVLHRHNINLVYGGGTHGLMGEVARVLVSLSGPSAVHGIIPWPLIKQEQAGIIPTNSEYGKTTLVKDMHTRKLLMARSVYEGGPGSGFIALSGGFGTMEELMEMTTWNQLGIHDKGVVVYNVDGFYDGILSWINNAADSGFIDQSSRKTMIEVNTAEDAVNTLLAYRSLQSKRKLNWCSL